MLDSATGTFVARFMSENKASPTNRLLCLGYGYTAQALAATLDRADWQVAGTVRDKKPRPAARPVTPKRIRRALTPLLSLPPAAVPGPLVPSGF